MKKVKTSKLEIIAIETIQAELAHFCARSGSKNALPKKTGESFLTDILLVDIAQRLFYKIRAKAEGYRNKPTSITLLASEAVTIMQVCTAAVKGDNPYRDNLFSSLFSHLHQELVNL